MKINEIYKLYDETKDYMKFYVSSDVRTKILFCLNLQPMNLRQIREHIHLSSSTILHAIYKLEEKNLVFRNSKKYYLSETGRIIILRLLGSMKTYYAINRYESFFLEHDISGIPLHLLNEVGCLMNSQIIKSTPDDVMKPYQTAYELLRNSKHVKTIYGVYYLPDHLFFQEILQNGASVDIILSQDILEKIRNTNFPLKIIDQYPDKLNIWQTDFDLKLTFTSNSNMISLSLYSNNGFFDQNKILVSTDKDAVRWGEKLFQYYLKKAEKTEF